MIAPPALRALAKATAVVALVLGLAGCGRSSGALAALPGPLPADTLCSEDACALAAARYFIGLHGPAVRGEDFAMWEALSLPTCEFCLDTLAVKDENAASGAVVTGAEAAIVGTPVMVDRDSDSGLVAMVVLADIDEATYHYLDGTTDSVPAAEVTLWIGMEWNGSYWQVRRIGVT